MNSKPQPHTMTSNRRHTTTTTTTPLPHHPTLTPNPHSPQRPEENDGKEDNNNDNNNKDNNNKDEDMEDPELEYTEEPHASRRREILQKHPEIKQLMGYDPWIAVIVTAQVFAQVGVCWLVQNSSWGAIFFLGYFLSPFFNQSLGVAMHEMGHNLAFGHRRPWMNRVLGIWCNLPLVVPMAITFKKYHADHHRFLGNLDDDVDVPCTLETYFFSRPFTKFLWIVLHPLFYAVRPFYKSPKPISGWEVVNILFQVTFNYGIYITFGAKALVYLLCGLAFGLSLHPLAAHYISEHYFLRGGEPTHSYYGPLNWILFNAGYHNEHHDFPYIPYSRLPEVRRLAPEYYDNLPYHSSWLKVLWDFIFDEKIVPHAMGQGAGKMESLLSGYVYRKVT